MTDRVELTTISEMNTEQVEDTQALLVPGSWYWLKVTNDKDDGTHEELVCVMRVGSNFAKVQNVAGYSWRVHFDNFDDKCRPEPNPTAYITARIETAKQEVRVLLGRIQQLTAGLGITRSEVTDGSSSTALAVAHGTVDIKAHKQALILAQKTTLPELFKLVEKEHERLAMWMKGELLPQLAQLAIMKKSTESISDRIFTVEIYAGLTEKLERIQDGEPAPNDTRVHLFQRRHYMDEECLARYEAGGMSFANINEFEAWLLRKENLDRILPMPRCCVAFRVRREDKEREGYSYSDFIRIMMEREDDKVTFLYMRNGDQVYRLRTAIDFGEELFPDQEHEAVLGAGDLWIKRHDSEPISQREYEDKCNEYQASRNKHAAKLREWRAGGKKGNEPWFSGSSSNPKSEYTRLTPETVYYDDGMEKISKMVRDHNRIAVVLQGLLDRSPTFHPHPPWQLWRPEGFALAIELVYDNSRALTNGPAPDFEAYRARLNRTIKKGSHTVGQDEVWLVAMAAIENERRSRDWRRNRNGGGRDHVRRYSPSGNPGPGTIAKAVNVRAGMATYRWIRTKLRETSYHTGKFKTVFRCKVADVLNADAYTAGDYRIFFDDPRTRAAYLKWAPLLLAAEDHVHGMKPMCECDDEERAAKVKRTWGMVPHVAAAMGIEVDPADAAQDEDPDDENDDDEENDEDEEPFEEYTDEPDAEPDDTEGDE